jgi:hypothetical protein
MLMNMMIALLSNTYQQVEVKILQRVSQMYDHFYQLNAKQPNIVVHK